MKKFLVPVLVVSLIVIGGVTYVLLGQGRLFPVIKDFGVVFEVPAATERPDTTMDYKIVVDIGQKNEKPGELYPPLEDVSRMYNLHVLGGVKQEKLDVAIAIWGEAIGVVMNNEVYKKKFGVDNPNLKAIAELKQAGVKIIGCGQSIKRLGYDPADVNPDVTVALSRFTAVSTYEMKGYAYFKY